MTRMFKQSSNYREFSEFSFFFISSPGFSPQEEEVVEHDGSCYVLGRSGTGYGQA